MKHDPYSLSIVDHLLELITDEFSPLREGFTERFFSCLAAIIILALVALAVFSAYNALDLVQH